MRMTDERRKETGMKFPPEVRFHEDIRLLVYRPRGVLDEAAVDKILNIVGDLGCMPC